MLPTSPVESGGCAASPGMNSRGSHPLENTLCESTIENLCQRLYDKGFRNVNGFLVDPVPFGVKIHFDEGTLEPIVEAILAENAYSDNGDGKHGD